MTERSYTYIATPPGVTIQERLNDLDISQERLAECIGMRDDEMNRLLKGEISITPETAFKLEKVLGISANFWLNLEAIYRVKLIKARAENAMKGKTVFS